MILPFGPRARGFFGLVFSQRGRAFARGHHSGRLSVPGPLRLAVTLFSPAGRICPGGAGHGVAGVAGAARAAIPPRIVLDGVCTRSDRSRCWVCACKGDALARRVGSGRVGSGRVGASDGWGGVQVAQTGVWKERERTRAREWARAGRRGRGNTTGGGERGGGGAQPGLGDGEERGGLIHRSSLGPGRMTHGRLGRRPVVAAADAFPPARRGTGTCDRNGEWHGRRSVGPSVVCRPPMDALFRGCAWRQGSGRGSQPVAGPGLGDAWLLRSRWRPGLHAVRRRSTPPVRRRSAPSAVSGVFGVILPRSFVF